MKRIVIAAAALLALALLPGCSSASGVCDAVKAGQDPVVAAGSSYAALGGPQKQEQAQKLRDAAAGIRSSCPEQSNAAARLESVAATVGA